MVDDKSSGGLVVEETPRTKRPDSYIRLPLYLAIAGATASVIWIRFLDFVPLGRGPSGTVRDLLNIFLPLGALILIAPVLVLIVWMMVALARRRFRRGLSLLCAVMVMPLIMWGGLRLTFFDPYYWYVMLNSPRFEREIKAETRAGVPTFVRLEDRDVSVGLVINPPTFTSIVYDESDELGRAAANRSLEWNIRNGIRLAADGGGNRMVYSAQHLYGHFYLVTSSYP
jgi:hypothetical protein